MTLATLDGRAFLAVNGTQTLSHTYCNLIGELAQLCRMGVSRFRLSPQEADMVAVARIFRDVLDGATEPEAAFLALDKLCGGVPFSNGFYHGAEGMALARHRPRAE